MVLCLVWDVSVLFCVVYNGHWSPAIIVFGMLPSWWRLVCIFLGTVGECLVVCRC